VVCDKSVLSEAARISKCKTKFGVFDAVKLPPSGIAAFHEVNALPHKAPVGKPSEEGGRASAIYIKEGVELSLRRYVSGIVTGPIHKKALNMAGVNFPGHTELLATLTSTKKYAMMLASEEMKVVVLSTHLSLKNAIKNVTGKAIVEKLMLIHRNVPTNKPIGVCGLNPHASDGGLFGDEERRIIAPAIKKARTLGINAVGPLPADTAFAPEIRSRYGAILAMYHDQGLVAIKSVSFGHCANITLGLPFIRTSVDHGTAMDIAGTGNANPSSMIYAIKSAFNLLE
jgi:4-hydroxythreonine-4-phosphate dehydrogenase